MCNGRASASDTKRQGKYRPEWSHGPEPHPEKNFSSSIAEKTWTLIRELRLRRYTFTHNHGKYAAQHSV